ncbi:hypothetical protein BGZ63DRAFT_377795 [Mariannaea sp. PMI_226]|nr:hypothetical protein BGZ63DRAFT_377795 [Mariannaea sp. PMI_226]
MFGLICSASLVMLLCMLSSSSLIHFKASHGMHPTIILVPHHLLIILSSGSIASHYRIQYLLSQGKLYSAYCILSLLVGSQFTTTSCTW